MLASLFNFGAFLYLAVAGSIARKNFLLYALFLFYSLIFVIISRDVSYYFTPHYLRYDAALLIGLFFIILRKTSKFVMPINFKDEILVLATLCFIFYQVIYSGGHLFFGYSSHNAAGAVAGMILISLSMTPRESQIKFILLLFVFVFAVFAAGSRQSILALIFAGILVKTNFIERSFWWIYILLTILSILLGLVFLELWIENGRIFPDHETGWSSEGFEFLPYRNETIAVRMLYYFPRAIEMFFQNPFFGTGLGSSNDRIEAFNCNGLLCNLRFEKVSYSADNPHNQFLTILAEQGIFGWFLLGLLLKSVYQSSNRHDRTLLMFGLFLSIFENRLASPSYFFTYYILSETVARKRL